MKPPFKPADASTVSPYLCVKGAADAISFYVEVFGARERFRMEKNGKVGHAELSFGETVVMIADEFPDMGFTAPADGNRSVQFVLYVPDVDATVLKAVAKGARIGREVQNQFYGDRSGQVIDPFGHAWHVSTHVEDVSPEELEKRAAAHAG